MAQKPLLVRMFMYFLKWGNLGDTTGIPTFIRSVITLIALFFLAILLFSGCQKETTESTAQPQIHAGPSPVLDVYEPLMYEPNYFYLKKGGKGKGKGPKNQGSNTPPPNVLAPIIDIDINLVSNPTGGCTNMTWDYQPHDQGYQIRILDNCYCSPAGVDSTSIAGEVHYIKYYNAFTEEAWMGCLNEIGKDRTYDLRLLWWVMTDSITNTWQPYYSEIYSVYVD